MPIYSFECDESKGGCANQFELQLTMQEFIDKVKTHKLPCPKCHKRKSVILLIQAVTSFIKGRTVGAVVDKNNTKISTDEKHHLTEKHTEYKKPPVDKPLPKGMTRGRDLVKR